MTKQEEFDTLAESLEFFEQKVMEQEAIFDSLVNECQIYNYKVLQDKVDEIEKDGGLSEEDMVNAEKLRDYLRSVNIPNKEYLIKEVNSTYKSLKALYFKQVSAIKDLKKFIHEEKDNPDVTITMHDEFLDPLLEITTEIMRGRTKMRKRMLRMVEDEEI